MEASPAVFTVGCLALSLVVLQQLAQRWSTNNRLLPPGPGGYPIIGNLIEWPLTKPWEMLTKWAELYGGYLSSSKSSVRLRRYDPPGDIYYVNLLGQKVMVINSVEVASSLLVQKAQSYSNRPPIVFGGELVGWNDFMSFLEDGPRLKEQRRLVAQEMGAKAVLERFTPMMEAKTREFICSVLDESSPEALLSHIRT
jgi:cytochrome P450